MSEVAHYPVIVIGGGQAGLAMSACLGARNIGHMVLEKAPDRTFLAHAALGFLLPCDAQLAVQAAELPVRRQ